MENLLGTPAKTVREKVYNILISFTILILYSTIMAHWVAYVDNEPYKPYVTNDNFLHYIFYVVLLAPLWEEAVFRYSAFQLTRWRKDLKLATFILSSFIFGWMHNAGSYSLLFQGMMGILAAWVYLKNNYSYWSSVIFHASWNLFLYFFPI